MRYYNIIFLVILIVCSFIQSRKISFTQIDIAYLDIDFDRVILIQIDQPVKKIREIRDKLKNPIKEKINKKVKLDN